MNDQFFSKSEIMARFESRQKENGGADEAGLALATLIMASALFGKKTWDGEDYVDHPIAVGMRNTRSTTKKIIGILHDVLEDTAGESDPWTLEDLKHLGFSSRVVRGVDHVTRRQEEPYFDFIVRCGGGADDPIDVKINDLEHNSTRTRDVALLSQGAVDKQNAYIISYAYLVGIKQGTVAPGTPIVDFLKTNPNFLRDAQRVNLLLQKFSSSPERLAANIGSLQQAFCAPCP